jgi:tRNA U34 5-carboxymethylaminomethyl modifying GTPase MnmE/TrmE
VDASSADAIDLLNRLKSTSQSELIVLTKTDVAPSSLAESADRQLHLPIVATSSVTGRGLDELAAAIAAVLSTTSATSRAACVAATADRCRDSVRLADAAVARAAEIAALSGGDELVAAEIRAALAELGYEAPAPIQARTIPALLAGKDVIGQAQTGVGKTAAFAISSSRRST